MIELKNSRTAFLGKASGRDRYSLDAFIGAVQMKETGGEWQDIKPHLVREADGWRVEGAPYYAEVKDDGTRSFCPDKNERGKYMRLPSPVYFSSLEKNTVSAPTKVDGQLLQNRVVIPTEWGEYRIIFSNTGMHFEVLFTKAPPDNVFGKDSPRILLDIESAGLDIGHLLKSISGVGIPKPRLLANETIHEQEKYLAWSYKNGRLELGLDFGDLAFPILLKNTTIDEQVGTSGDDGFIASFGIDTSSTFVRLGQWGGYVRHAWYRFTGITIPQGSTIDVCYLSLREWGTAGSPLTTIYFEKANDPAAPGDWVDYLSRNLTAGVAWNGDPGADQYYDSSSLVTPMQELINAYGLSDQAIQVIHKDNGSTSTHYRSSVAWDYDDHSLAPKLHIEYTVGGATEKGGIDSGSGADVKTDFLAGLTKADSGSGADTGLSLLAGLAGDDNGAGSEQRLLSLLISSTDAGAGVEVAAMLLAGIIKSDSGSGIENILDRALNLPDSGSGADILSTLIATILKSETGVGIDQGILASIVARLSADTGSGVDVAELIAGLVSSETGLGIDAGVIVGLKQLFSGDEGVCGEVLKALISTSGKGSDMKLPGRQGRVGMPSRGVSL